MPRQMELLRQDLEQIAEGLIDDMVTHGPPIDLVSAFALPLPSLVISSPQAVNNPAASNKAGRTGRARWTRVRRTGQVWGIGPVQTSIQRLSRSPDRRVSLSLP